MAKKLLSEISNLKSNISNQQSLRVLMVEDSEDDEMLLIREHKKGGYNPVYERVANAAAMKKALKEKKWDIILCDYMMPGFDAPSAINILKEANLEIPLIVVTGTSGEEMAIDCMRFGAKDYIMKANLSRLCPAISRALEEAEVKNKHKQAEELLNASEVRYRRLFESAKDGILILDCNTGIIVDVNPFLVELLGYSREQFIEKAVWELGPFKDIIPNRNKFLELQRQEYIRYENLPLETINGRLVNVEFVSNVYTEGDTNVIQCNIRDITERKEALKALQKSEKKYRKLSIIDDLTQLHNSRHFHAQLKIETERANRYEQPLTLLLMDIDKFKEFNDTYGHVEGDNVLSQFGKLLKRFLRETDSAYRYGGEEFTIILPMTTDKEGIIMAERIQTELREKSFSPVSGQKVYLTVSMGLAQYKPNEEIKTFVHRVDQFMYQAKKKGRDRIIVNYRVKNNSMHSSIC
ncbi:MAG: diguanylate cyclase [Smithella sp.]|jgi:diguanylate cyclase (GGDEF)-like protein/PAS domain S-box-containing protein|nr:diguanylate cyclase [Smithella sp.]MDD5525443.1 diguanylate cyclase [Smithella sp.]